MKMFSLTKLLVACGLFAILTHISLAADVGVRVRLGLNDDEATAWDGTVSVKPGKVALISGWRFEQGDHANGTDGWTASTRAASAFDAAGRAADAAESDIRASEAALRIARLTHDRIASLHTTRSATSQELDQATASLGAAEAQLAGANARAAGAGAARDEAQAARRGAQITASYAVLTAPFDGVVAERAADPGAMAMPGAPLLTLEDTSRLRLEVRLDESRASRVALGQTVGLAAGEDAAAWTAGRVVEIARLDATSHGFVVKIELPAGVALRSGQFARARFEGPTRRTLTVPAGAVTRRGQLSFVFEAAADGTARLRPVAIGAMAAGRIELLAGIHDGDRVVIDPPASLGEGTRLAGAAR
jgi:RND family efflux transporter MFP subunit